MRKKSQFSPEIHKIFLAAKEGQISQAASAQMSSPSQTGPSRGGRLSTRTGTK